MTLNQYMIVSALIFGIGMFTVIGRKNLIGVIIGLELMLSSVSLNLIAFGRFSNVDTLYSGQTLAIFVIVLATAQTVIGLAMVFVLAKRFKSVDSETAEGLKG